MNETVAAKAIAHTDVGWVNASLRLGALWLDMKDKGPFRRGVEGG